MKQPYNTTIYNTALYMRLSRDDELQGESGSIQTQDVICQGYFLRKISVVNCHLESSAERGLQQFV